MNKFLLSILLSVTSLFVFAQAKQTYNGSFKGGTATYSYYDSPNGRIYDGEFTFSSNYLQSGFRKITGSFTNNLRDGEWHFVEQFTSTTNTTSARKGDVLKSELICSYENGNRQGKWEHINYLNGKEVFHATYYADNNYMDGDVTYVDNNKYERTEVTGRLKKGKPIDIWICKITQKNQGTKVTYCNYNGSSSSPISMYMIDDETGEKIEAKGQEAYTIFRNGIEPNYEKTILEAKGLNTEFFKQ